MRILILRALKLGDFLTAVPAYRAIRRAYPQARITLAAPREWLPLTDLLNGAIDELVHARELEPLSADVSGADVGIDLHGKGPESQRLLLAAGARRVLSFAHPDVPETAGGARHDPAEHEVTRWCRMLEHFGIPAHPGELDLPVPPIVLPSRARGATLIHPGASAESRCWPVERWAAVARSERERGRRVILTGSLSERGRTRLVAEAAGLPPSANYAGRTSVRELAALVAGAGCVVCGDTGIAHLASAFRRPSVVLFGPTPPSGWGPPLRPYHRVVWTGSTGDPHADRIDAGLSKISVERVVAELAKLPAA